MTAATHDALEPCAELEHDSEEGLGEKFYTLHPGHTTEGRCAPGEYKDYKLVVSPDHADSNLVVIVQEQSGKTIPDAIATYMYADSIPDNRETEVYQTFSTTGS